MDVREQLRTAPPGPTPSDDDARRVFQRGRRRVVRRRVTGAGAALAVVLVAVVVATPFGPPGSPIVDDEVAGTPDPATPDPDPGPETPRDPVDAPDPQQVEVGQVVLTIPDGVTLTRAGSGPEPCYAETTEPTLVVMDAIVPDEQADCPGGAARETTIVAVPANAVPPMFLPGHGTADGTADTSDVDLLDTGGVVEVGTLADGTTPIETYLFRELDLYLAVVAPDRTPGVVDDLLSSAVRAEDPTDDGSEDPGGAPPLDAGASMDDRESPPAGAADLELVDIRVGAHDGFDRVTLVLAGEGEAGWFMSLGDQAFQDGSGDLVEVDGEAVLEVMVNMLAFPPDLPDPVDWNGQRFPAPAGAGVLTEVVGSIWFEGQQQVFIGLEEAVAYRVARFTDPQLLVIDLVHP